MTELPVKRMCELADDQITFPLPGFDPFGHRVGPVADLGEVAQDMGVRGLTAGLAGSAAGSSPAQTLACSHVEAATVDGGVDRLRAHRATAVDAQASSDPRRREPGPRLVGDPLTQHGVHDQPTGPATSP